MRCHLFGKFNWRFFPYIHGGLEIIIEEKNSKELTDAITSRKEMPSKGKVLEWMKEHDSRLTEVELQKAGNMLDELEDLRSEESSQAAKFYGSNHGLMVIYLSRIPLKKYYFEFLVSIYNYVEYLQMYRLTMVCLP